MFPTNRQSNADAVGVAKAEYQAARNRSLELQQERTALLAAPLATSEQLRIVGAALERGRETFEAGLDEMLRVMHQPRFNAADDDCLDRLLSCWLSGPRSRSVTEAAIATAMAETILAYVGKKAAESGADQSELTLMQRHTELARLDVLIVEQEAKATRALNNWRQATGDINGYP